jgi:hypothetical protein
MSADKVRTVFVAKVNNGVKTLVIIEVCKLHSMLNIFKECERQMK